MKKIISKIKFLFINLLILFFLASCSKTDKNGEPIKKGFIYFFLIKPFKDILIYLSKNLNINYGWTIIFITIIIRIILFPFSIKQAKNSLIQTEKIQKIKPELNILQKKMKSFKKYSDQIKIQKQIRNLYKKHNINIFGGVTGCLTFLLQIPIFSAIFFAIKYTKEINQSFFFNINLGKPFNLFIIIAGIIYLIQGYISTININKEQIKTMKPMIFFSSIMIIIMSIDAPSGVTLYWIISGIFSCIQTFISNVILFPKLKNKI